MLSLECVCVFETDTVDETIEEVYVLASDYKEMSLEGLQQQIAINYEKVIGVKKTIQINPKNILSTRLENFVDVAWTTCRRSLDNFSTWLRQLLHLKGIKKAIYK